jgi:hypothetical protein
MNRMRCDFACGPPRGESRSHVPLDQVGFPIPETTEVDRNESQYERLASSAANYRPSGGRWCAGWVLSSRVLAIDFGLFFGQWEAKECCEEREPLPIICAF